MAGKRAALHRHTRTRSPSRIGMKPVARPGAILNCLDRVKPRFQISGGWKRELADYVLIQRTTITGSSPHIESDAETILPNAASIRLNPGPAYE